MAGTLPPPPMTSESNNSFVWLEWYRQLRNFIQTSGSVPWAVVDKAGAQLADLPTRPHSSLQSIQGGTSGNYYHLIKALSGSITFDFPNIGAVATSTTTVTVAGAATGDTVLITPSTALEAGLVIYGYVSAADTITIVANNPTAGAINPASRTYYVSVIKC
jgi:hypothetical protein